MTSINLAEVVSGTHAGTVVQVMLMDDEGFCLCDEIGNMNATSGPFMVDRIDLVSVSGRSDVIPL